MYVLCIQCIWNVLEMIIIAVILVYSFERILFFLSSDDIVSRLKKEDMAIWLKKEWKRGEVKSHLEICTSFLTRFLSVHTIFKCRDM